MLVTLRKGWSATRESIKFWTVDLIRDLRASRNTQWVCPFDRLPLQNLHNGGYGCPKCGGTEGMPELSAPKAPHPKACAPVVDSEPACE